MWHKKNHNIKTRSYALNKIEQTTSTNCNISFKNVHCSGTYKRSHEELDKDSGPGVKPPFFSVTPIG